MLFLCPVMSLKAIFLLEIRRPLIKVRNSLIACSRGSLLRLPALAHEHWVCCQTFAFVLTLPQTGRFWTVSSLLFFFWVTVGWEHHAFTFSLAVHGSKERRTTARAVYVESEWCAVFNTIKSPARGERKRRLVSFFPPHLPQQASRLRQKWETDTKTA